MKTTVKFQISRVLLTTSLVFLCSSSFANASGIIKGHVLDSKKQPLNYATATILDPETMKIVEGDMCDNKGEFIIENVKPGNYILSIRMLGYKKDESKRISINSEKELIEIDNVVLHLATHELAEVVVTAKPKTTEQVAEKSVVTTSLKVEPTSNLLINQFDFTTNYKSFFGLTEMKNFEMSIGVKPIVFFGNYLIGLTNFKN